MVTTSIRNTVLVQLPPPCQAFIGSLQLMAFSESNSNVTQYIPQVPIDLDCCVSENNPIDTIHFSSFEQVPVKYEELQFTQNRIAQLDMNIDSLLFHRHVNKYYHWYTITLAILFILVSFCCCQCCCRCNPISMMWNYFRRQPSCRSCLRSLTIYNHVGSTHHDAGNIQLSNLRDTADDFPSIEERRSLHSDPVADPSVQPTPRWTTNKAY